ncbi:integrase arm-type DNA-binding domain-containing protein [Methylobacter sp.]|uniref:tyrosine-type recombinase/integrase n=1 Tax=Methylobacter sp. TaxID=2051955 RepID=UPI0025FB582E|nr:integrase arm-type DNA-binding domain-containing protein [Methylobacter sp.]
MAKLEDKQIRMWIKNNIRFDAKSDGSGLYIRYRETDKSPIWFLRFKIAKIEQRLILGRYPDISLVDARKSAAIHRSEILKGHNPAETKRELKRAAAEKAIIEQSAQTVSDLVDEFFLRNVDGKLKTAHTRRLRVNKYLIPAIGKLSIKSVEPTHISAMLNKITGAGAPTTANDILSHAKQIFNYAIKLRIIKHNPAAAFNSSDAGGKESLRKRYLSHDELARLFHTMRECDKFTRHHYLCTKLLLLLGCRKSELLTAKIADFDIEKAVWRMSLDNKMESAIDIPLSRPALDIIGELTAQRIGTSEYLIPAMGGRTGKKPHVDEGYLNKPIKNLLVPLMGDIENFTIHDFRTTMKTNLIKHIGADRFVAERCLNNKIPDMAGIYDRYDYFQERKEALELWAKFLNSCENGLDWNLKL